MDLRSYDRLELRICRRNRLDRPDKPGCSYNLTEDAFSHWKQELFTAHPGLRILYSEYDCLGLCPRKGVAIQCGLRPIVARSLQDIQKHIDGYAREESIQRGMRRHEENNS